MLFKFLVLPLKQGDVFFIIGPLIKLEHQYLILQALEIAWCSVIELQQVFLLEALLLHVLD